MDTKYFDTFGPFQGKGISLSDKSGCVGRRTSKQSEINRFTRGKPQILGYP